MKNFGVLARTAVGAAVLFGAGIAHAALEDRGGGLVYDTALNVTWLADANLSMSQTFGVSGISQDIYQYGSMSWYTAQQWIAGMNTAKYLGYSDWRMPNVRPVNGVAFNDQFSTDGTTDMGYNITSQNSEMAHLANVDLKNLHPSCSPASPVGSPNCKLYNYGLFTNVNIAFEYMTSAEVYPGSPNLRAFVFRNPVTVGSVPYEWGYQGQGNKGLPGIAMVLRTGDVASVVPEPATCALLLAGLGALSLKSRRRKY